MLINKTITRLVFFCGAAVAANAAIVTNVTTDATALANALKGTSSIVINSATLNADAEVGGFTETGTPLFFSEGVFLTSGVASCLSEPPDGECGLPGNGTSAELVIEFTPDVAASSIGFNYFFASEEFPRFVGEEFQDSFEFEVNGVNYAKLPNGNTVTIDNVWTSGHYIPNHDTATALGKTYGAAVFDDRTGMNGYTKMLQFVAPINPGVTNTLRLFITDVSDTQLDSAVLLQAGSLVVDPKPIPEPTTFALAAGGAALALLLKKRAVR